MDTGLTRQQPDWQLASATIRDNARPTCRLFFFSETLPDCARNVGHVYAPVQKHGPVLESDAPWESGGSISPFCGTIIGLDDGRLRLYYSLRAAGNLRIAVAESEDGLTWTRVVLGQEKRDGRATNLVVFTGVPGAPDGVPGDGQLTDRDGTPLVRNGEAGKQHHVGQPQVLRLPGGGWRMYYWHHQHGWGEGPEPYTIAESGDGLRWHVTDYARPALNRHGSENRDPATLSREEHLLEKQRRTNDANYVYWNPRLGCYEQFSQYFVKAPPERRVKIDNQADNNRVIQRRVSADGKTWSSPELVIQPDGRDPLDQQFYYLAVQYHGDWLIGSLGHYRAGAQTMDLELAFSRDGRKWERPLRGGFIPRDPRGRDAGMVHAPNAWIDRGDRWLCLYGASARKHNQGGAPGFPAGCVMAASWAKNRLVGLHAGPVPGGFMTPVFFPRSGAITLDGNIRGWLRAELCDAWGRKLEGHGFEESAVLRGDDPGHVLRWNGGPGDDFTHDPVRLRLEFADADIFSVAFS